jgi:Outer membrane protein beta-barrel domain
MARGSGNDEGTLTMKRTAMAGAALLALVSWSAQADDYTGWRAGLAATFGNFDSDAFNLKDNTVGFKLHGQYQFGEFFGVEGAFYTSGDYSQFIPGTGSAKQSFSGFMVHGIGYLPAWFGEDLRFYGKLGYYNFTDDLSVNNVAQPNGREDGVAVGAGATLKISKNFDVRGDFDWFNADVGSLWSINLGVEYLFGHHRKTHSTPASAPAAPANAAPTTE